MPGIDRSNYRILDTGTVPAFIDSRPEIRGLLGGPRERWQVQEVGDGNLNIIFFVQ